MKKLIFLETLAACAITLMITSSAKAAVDYDITFTGGGVSASGVVDVGAGGLVVGGYLDVSSGPNQGSFNFQPVLDYENVNGDNTGNDNLVFLGTPADFLDIGGLSFGNYFQGYGLWDNGGGVYELWGYDYYPPFTEHGGADSGYGVPDVLGTATLAAAPDGGMTFGLLGGALLGLKALRRKLS
jgi:hypothetical protein